MIIDFLFVKYFFINFNITLTEERKFLSKGKNKVCWDVVLRIDIWIFPKFIPSEHIVN